MGRQNVEGDWANYVYHIQVDKSDLFLHNISSPVTALWLAAMHHMFNITITYIL